MRVVTAVAAFASAVFASSGFAQPKATSSPVTWGEFIDVRKDVEVSGTNEEFAIRIPANRPHDLAAEYRSMDAPRILAKREGDFEVRAAVAAPTEPGARIGRKEQIPYFGAGILLWEDEGNYVRLEHAMIFPNRADRMINLEQRHDGKCVLRRQFDLAEIQRMHLRATRRGADLEFAVSVDGIDWVGLGRLKNPLRKELRVGVAAVNNTPLKFEAKFSDVASLDDRQAPKSKSAVATRTLLHPNTPVLRILETKGPVKFRDVRFPGWAAIGSPAFSPDGDWIAMDAYSQSQKKPFVMIGPRASGAWKRIAAGSTPSWAPDGKRLLFMRELAEVPNGAIFEINVDGTGERQITVGRWPSLSPDGQSLTFSRGGLESTGARFGSSVYVADADGSNDQKRFDGDCPSWSPDGKRIAYCVRREALEPLVLEVGELESGKTRKLGPGWFRPIWAPDGESLVACGRFQDLYTIPIRYSLRPAGGVEPFVVGRTQLPHSPCISPKGNLAAYVHTVPLSRHDIETMAKPAR